MRSTTRCAPSSRSPMPRARRCSTRSTVTVARIRDRLASGEAHLDSLRQPDDTGPLLRRVLDDVAGDDPARRHPCRHRRHPHPTRRRCGHARRTRAVRSSAHGTRPRSSLTPAAMPCSTKRATSRGAAHRRRAARSRRSRSTACAACTDARPRRCSARSRSRRCALRARAVRRARLPLRQPPAGVPQAPRHRPRRADASATTRRCVDAFDACGIAEAPMADVRAGDRLVGRVGDAP